MGNEESQMGLGPGGGGLGGYQQQPLPGNFHNHQPNTAATFSFAQPNNAVGQQQASIGGGFRQVSPFNAPRNPAAPTAQRKHTWLIFKRSRSRGRTWKVYSGLESFPHRRKHFLSINIYIYDSGIFVSIVNWKLCSCRKSWRYFDWYFSTTFHKT